MIHGDYGIYDRVAKCYCYIGESKNDEIMDITEWPTNIHEYHAMMATAQAKAMGLKQMQEKATNEPKKKEESNESE